MLENLRNRSSDESGFTLVELLVVMLILGILAAIAVPSFFSQRDKATDAEAKSAVRTAQTAMETYNTDNDGSYVGAEEVDLIAIEPTLEDAALSIGTTPALGDDSYNVTVKSGTDTSFTITRTGGTTDQTCDVPGEGGCQGTSGGTAGTW